MPPSAAWACGRLSSHCSRVAVGCSLFQLLDGALQRFDHAPLHFRRVGGYGFRVEHVVQDQVESFDEDGLLRDCWCHEVI